ncbi:maltokinase N-terminal cap-like domain-containing protein [Streptomyces sp. enrichment culture]|uniref:maltokinase N-terminal cap-like domain-containing protein n=1 Tax=Streptomyces sp. enrichment culture TaxID=1795815 RepID=UPI003F54F7EE
MAVIHRTTAQPSKLELLTSWLPSRPWYRGGAGAPEFVKAGGFRLDDPQGEVGIEFLVVTDARDAQPVGHLVPLSYRGVPLDGAEHALVGTMEHGVLGRRWVYDGCHDPVMIAALCALVEGRTQAQDQNVSDTPDRDITRSYTGDGPISASPAASAVAVADDAEGTALSFPGGAVLRLRRVLRPAPDGPARLPQGAVGQVSGSWRARDGVPARSLFAVLYPRIPTGPSGKAAGTGT